MNNQIPFPSNETNQSRFSYGYIIILASFLILMVSWGSQYSFGVFLKPMLNEFGWARAAVSGAYSLNMVLMGISAVLAGRLSDRFGPRLVLSICALLIGTGYLLMSRVNAIWQIYLVYGILLSVGMSGMFVPLMSNLIRWFPRMRGLASGIVASGIGIGILVAPLLANLIISLYGWQTSYIIVGFTALVSIAVVAQFLRRIPNHMDPSVDDNKAARTKTTSLHIQGFSLREATSSRQFWIIFVIFLFFVFGQQMVMVHIVAHATDIKFTPSSAAAVLSVIGGVSIASKVLMGAFGDRIGNRNIMIIVVVLISMSYLWLRLVNELWMLYLFAVVFALGYGGSASTQSPLVADFFGLRAHGAIFGLVSFANSVGGALGSLIGGYIFDISGSYQWAFLLCAVLSIVALILSILLKPANKHSFNLNRQKG